MAAITYWIDPVSGDNGNDGLSFANAFQTTVGFQAAAQAAGNGNDYTLNLVNTGTHTHDGAVKTQIDGQTTSTLTVQGTDSSGNPALATVNATGAATATSSFIVFREHNGITCKYVKFKTTDATGSNTFLYTRDNATAAVTFQYCQVEGLALGGTGGTFRQSNLMEQGSAAVWQGLTLQYCTFRNVTQVQQAYGKTLTIDNCVWIYDYDSTNQIGTIYNVFTSSAQVATITNNTFYFRSRDTTTVAPAATGIINITNNSGTQGTWTVTDNVVWVECDVTDGVDTATANVVKGGGGTAAFGSADIGYNVLWFGPDITTATNNPTYYLNAPWAPDGGGGGTYGDVYTNDTEGTGEDTALFKDPTTTYTWTPTGSSVDLTVDYDLRLVDNTAKTAGTGGALPGALPAASVDPSISVVTYDSTTVVEGDKVTVYFTYTEDSADNTAGTTVAVSFPSQFTRQKTKVTSGSYSASSSTAGTWTIGSLSLGGTATLTMQFRVNTSVSGETSLPVTGTISAHGSGLDLGGTTSDDTGTVTFAGLTIADVPTDVEIPDAPARVPYIDVMPINEPRYEVDTNIRLKTSRNRQQENYLRFDEEGTLFSEFRCATVNLATNTTMSFNLGGIERANYLMMESDVAVQLAFNGGTYLPAAKHLSVTQGQLSSLKVKNPSTSSAAEVHIVVVD